jgi:hypothetical protein
MPKNNNKKGKGKGASKNVDASAADANNDLDDILTEVLAGDLQKLPSDGSNVPTITAGSNASNTGPADARATEVSVPEATSKAAIRRGDTAQLKRCGRRGVRVRSVTPLLIAVGTGARNAVFKILVRDLSADVNQADRDGYTPLTQATFTGRLDTMRCLVVELSDIDQEDNYSYSPVTLAAHKGNLAALRCLVNAIGDSPLISATYVGKFGVVRCLVTELGVDVNHGKDDGTTALSTGPVIWT